MNLAQRVTRASQFFNLMHTIYILPSFFPALFPINDPHTTNGSRLYHMVTTREKK